MIERHRTRRVRVGSAIVGGDAPVSVQSMTKTDTRDAESTLSQIRRLAEAGCEIVRCAVPDVRAAEALEEIRKGSPLPVVADVHFDYRLALRAIEAGADKLRINPGNIGGRDRMAEVAKAARERGIPVRIGVNAGSLEKDLIARHGGPCVDALVESALRNARILEDLGLSDIVISVKATDVRSTVEAYEAVAKETDYPLHVGLTEAGGVRRGTVKSSMAIGALLLKGIGDTIRVSLTADPVEEVAVGQAILSGLGIRSFGVEVISCPTCGRCHGDLGAILREVEREVAGLRAPMKVAVMGCEVNGPGEASEADIGVALGDGVGLLFVRGRPAGRVPQDAIVDSLVAEILRLSSEGRRPGSRDDAGRERLHRPRS